jgi:hypothetical protein
MGGKRDDVKADAMYALYQDGHSLAQVAAAFGVTRQGVYKMFALRGWECRQRPEPLPFVVFGGNKYTLRNTGYYGRTDGDRTLLHRDMWEAKVGAIPAGYDVHHCDGDRTNNVMSNLALMPKPEHTRLHHR